MCFCFSEQYKKYTITFTETFLSFLYPNEAVLRRQVFTLARTRGKSRFDWLLNNANRHDKNGALKSAFDKHQPGSHQKIAFDTKGFFPHLHLRCSVGGQPLGWVWSVVRLWFRERLGVSAVILWKQTNLGNQSHCLERVKVPFHLLYQPRAVSLKEFVLYSKCSLGSSVYVIMQLLSALHPLFYIFQRFCSSRYWTKNGT